jgi:hypothetical protein
MRFQRVGEETADVGSIRNTKPVDTSSKFYDLNSRKWAPRRGGGGGAGGGGAGGGGGGGGAGGRPGGGGS